MRLADELRAVRRLAGLSQHEMAERIDASQRTVSRIETADRLPERAVLHAWLSESPEDTRARVLALAEAAHTETRPWGQLRDGGHLQGTARSDEDVALAARVFCTSFVPGLLQTAEYTRRLMPEVDPSGDANAAVAARMQRQQVLYDDTRRFQFLITEAGLLWSPELSVMPAQRDRLLSLATLSSVEIAVLPSHRSGVVGWHDFIVWSAPDRPSWVTVEMRHGGARVADPDAVTDYENLWARLWDAAVRGDEAVGLIRALP